MADEKTEAKEKQKREMRFKRDQKITLLADKDGKPYGPENNPKRAGSKSEERFKLYKNGISVQDYLDAGGRSPDIAWDVDKKYISVK